MMTAAEICKALMLDYEIPDVSDARDRNLNRFMQFCGVTYQMVTNSPLVLYLAAETYIQVRTGASTRRVGMEPEPGV